MIWQAQLVCAALPCFKLPLLRGTTCLLFLQLLSLTSVLSLHLLAGYEEAAAQGLVAGLNAARRAAGQVCSGACSTSVAYLCFSILGGRTFRVGGPSFGGLLAGEVAWASGVHHVHTHTLLHTHRSQLCCHASRPSFALCLAGLIDVFCNFDCSLVCRSLLCCRAKARTSAP